MRAKECLSSRVAGFLQDDRPRVPARRAPVPLSSSRHRVQPRKILLQLLQARINAHRLRCPPSGKPQAAFACCCLRRVRLIQFRRQLANGQQKPVCCRYAHRCAFWSLTSNPAEVPRLSGHRFPYWLARQRQNSRIEMIIRMAMPAATE